MTTTTPTNEKKKRNSSMSSTTLTHEQVTCSWSRQNGYHSNSPGQKWIMSLHFVLNLTDTCVWFNASNWDHRVVDSSSILGKILAVNVNGHQCQPFTGTAHTQNPNSKRCCCELFRSTSERIVCGRGASCETGIYIHSDGPFHNVNTQNANDSSNICTT